jgi:hypothetical protein
MTTPGEGFPELTFAASVPPQSETTSEVRATTGTTVVPSAMEGEEGGSRVISWHYLLWETPKIAAPGEIQAVETELNVRPTLPNALVDTHPSLESAPATS